MAYKGRILDCLTSEGRKFFKDEFKANDKEASLRRLENLIVDVLLPYKIGLFFFLATTLALSGYLMFRTNGGGNSNDQSALKAENLKLRDDLEVAKRQLNVTPGGIKPEVGSVLAGLDTTASLDPDQFYNIIGDLAEKKQIPKDEIVRLIKVGQAQNPAYALMRVRAKPALSSALSPAELAELVKQGTPK